MENDNSMAKKTPKVDGQQLYLPGQASPVCCLDSVAWFTWLETASAFRYHSQERLVIVRSYGPRLAPISLRREKRRRSLLWYAYRRSHGILHKRYVGRSRTLTTARLDEVALELNLIW